ncbi:MAG: CNNM domain-containing protein [Kiritimatiellae bacterium]|nr:CNNM domain-containing protein [Kiritimatiellia bacterium]MCO6400631.1 DUF21 domain-containing protein [Verrucomicrobiota bacterium]
MSALELIILTFGLLGSWFFSGMETGLISINRLRLRHFVRRKVEGAATLQYFLEHPDQLLGTLLVGNNVVNTVTSVVAVSVATRLWGGIGSWIASILTTLVLLVFCEYFPKAWFQSFPTARCLKFAPILAAADRLMRPVSRIFVKMLQTLVPLPGENKMAPFAITREELIHLTKEVQKGGALTGDEVRMITSVMELQTITCEEIMVPRDQVVYIHHDTGVEDIRLFARARPFNQFPVYDRDKKDFVGVVYIMDVLCDPNPAGKQAKDYMRRPQLVDKAIPADHVLPRMRVTRQPVVLVTDGNKGVVGLLPMARVVSEFVGV